jgi:hypothetical protein
MESINLRITDLAVMKDEQALLLEIWQDLGGG